LTAAPSSTVEVVTEGGVYSYQRSNLYLTHGKPTGGGGLHALPESYARMDTNTILSHRTIVNALNAAPDNDRTRLIIIAITSEAARSQVVYQVIQRVLHSTRLEVAWSGLSPLFGVRGRYTAQQTTRTGRREGYHHKSKPIGFGPLGVRDHYNEPAAVAAMEALKAAGFTLDC
jgi:hypothetical protein